MVFKSPACFPKNASALTESLRYMQTISIMRGGENIV